MSALDHEVEVTIPGWWDARPVSQSDAEWVEVTATPAKVRIAEGQCYRLRVSGEAGEEQLQGLLPLRAIPTLLALEIVACPALTDAGMANVGALTSLQRLDVQWCQAVTDAGLAHLRHLTNLQDLNLTWVTEMTDAGLASLHGLTHLQALALDCCWNVTPEAVEAFKACVPGCVIEGP